VVHESICVQGLLSSQLVPSGAAGFEHMPVVASQVPGLWQESVAAQVTGLPTQEPAWQLSCCVHGLLSLQLVPSGALGLLH
jgi:hypothetical protein